MIKSLIEEYELEIDDIRWYLSHYLVGKVQSLLFDPIEAARYIWSGELEGFLYNMEERFIHDLEDQYSRNLLDEGNIRTTLEEIRMMKIKRDRNN